MIALAIYEKYDVIELYGVDMSVDTEYSVQRPSVEYWLGIAKGKGIKTYVPTGSTLLKSFGRYGYDIELIAWQIDMIKDKTKYLKEQEDAAARELENNVAKFNQYVGMGITLDHIVKWINEGKNLKEIYDQSIHEQQGVQEARAASAKLLDKIKAEYNQYMGSVMMMRELLREWDNIKYLTKQKEEE